MTKYEEIRKEINAIERELSALRHILPEGRQEGFKELCLKNDRIKEAFAAIKQAI